MPLLEPPRLRIRPFEQKDLAAFAAYRSDEEVARYQGWNTPYTLDQALAFFHALQQTPEDAPEAWIQLIIERKSDHAVLGDCAFKLSRDTRQAEIGCTIARPYWGAGCGREATHRLLAYLFEDRKLHRVTANCDVENPAAARTLEAAGLRREAHFIENLWFKGRWSSEYWYAMLASEWHAASPPPAAQQG